jgi:hypothetical protein
MRYTRRDFGRLAITSLPAIHLFRTSSVSAFQTRPNSKVRGVMIGMNVPYNFGGRNAPVDEIIRNCVQLGISGVELRTHPVEAFLGVPAHLVPGARGGGGRARGCGSAEPAPAGERGAAGGERGAGRSATPPPTPEQEAERKANAEELRKWRLAVPMEKVRALRKTFEDAGVFVEIVKVDGILTMPDDVVDYEFALAKNLGARAISTEIAVPETKRLGQFADKHKMMVGYHGHATTTAADFETAFSYAAHKSQPGHRSFRGGAQHVSGAIHQAASQSDNPRSRQGSEDEHGPNVPFGQGATPIKEVLQLIRDNKWNIQATIEFEYPVPEGSDRMGELKKCSDYCRAALA